MRIIDFNLPVERRGTDSYKWDFNAKEFGNSDALPLWVADMDFPCAPEILESLQKRLEHGVLGYTARGDGYINALTGWFERRHKWIINPEHITFAPPGVIFGINVLIGMLTLPGEKVLMQTPNYDSLMDSVVRNGRQIAENPLKLINGRYEMDFENLEMVIDEKTRLLIMTNPNNPTGRMWTRAELTKLGEICVRHNIIIISDDIHCDILPKNGHYFPIASISKEIEQLSIVCLGVNKTFNLGGLHMGTIVIGNDVIRQRYNAIMQQYQTRLDNIFGQLALEVAYNKCDYWVDQAVEYIWGNRDALAEYIKKNLPQLKFHPMEATYFAWVDFSALGKGADLMRFLVQDCGVAFTNGAEFSKQTSQHMRINLATQRARILEAFEKIFMRVNNT